MASERVQRQIDRLLDEAEEAISNSKWTLVHDRAQNALALDPGNSDGLAYLAAAERALGSSSAPSSKLSSDLPAASLTSSTVDSQEIQPSVFANGRYQVKRFLEEGGKKKVYLATDTLLDRDVAFALIKTEGLDDSDGVAKIGDFGLAVAIDRSRLTTEGMMVGTVSICRRSRPWVAQ